MSEIQFTTIDRIFSKLSREINESDINESDIIEWVGEALDALKVYETQEQAVYFAEVKNFEVDLPKGFQMVLQVARNYNWKPEKKEDCYIKPEEIEEITEECIKQQKEEILPCRKKMKCCNECDENSFTECPKYIPYFDMQWQYIPWTTSNHYKDNYIPVRLANNTLFNSIVCKEKTTYNAYCKDCDEDEYTIVGSFEKKLRFSFKEGYIALSYLRTMIDDETGYPLIPDDYRCINAITHYVMWRIAKKHVWNRREGFKTIADDNERLWLRYVKQAKNYFKMPKSIDQYQNLLEQSHYLIPRNRRYYGFFGNLGREEILKKL